MTDLLLRIGFGLGIAILVAWLLLVVLLLAVRPEGLVLKEVLRLLPDTLRLLKRLAIDSTLPNAVRVQLFLLFGYLALPFDIIPDFIPVLGHVDDAIVVLVVLRSIVKRAGPEAMRRHWVGTEDGLATLFKAAGLPLQPDSDAC